MTPLPNEIIYLAVNRWDSLVQREQHLILGLSRSYRILFVDPPLSFLTVSLGKMHGKSWNFRSHLHWVNEQLIVYTPPAFPPFSKNLHGIRSFHTDLLIFLIRRLLRKFSFSNYILGVGNPFLGKAVEVLNHQLSYYDCSDDYPASPRLKGSREMARKLEEGLVRSVDLVFCTSAGLLKSKSILNQNCFLVPNGVDLAVFFKQTSQPNPPLEVQRVRRPMLGYIGLIDERIDVDALRAVAKGRPDWSFVMIGPATSKHTASALMGFPNIYLLGERNYDELPGYVEAFDLCVIPFKMGDFTRKIYPTKLHQYLAAGKPVVSSPLPDLEAFRPWVMFYHHGKEMEEVIERSLREDSKEKVLQRKKIASENTWDQRVTSIVEILNHYLEERTSPMPMAKRDAEASSA